MHRRFDRSRRRRRGFTVLELMIVLGIVGISAALAVPAFTRMSANWRLRDAMRGAGNAFQTARSQAISTGANHIVFLGTGAATDACGNALEDVNGQPVPFLILNDGLPGTAGANCCIDPGEPFETLPAELGTFWGATFAPNRVASDVGGGPYGSGSTFNDANGNPTRWVMFRPDGIPVGFNAACQAGDVGSGGGGVYGTNLQRDYGVVLSPLGAVKVHTWDNAQGAWTN